MLRLSDPDHASRGVPVELQAAEVRLDFWRTVSLLRNTILSTREIHAQQRLSLESIRLQQLLSVQNRRRSLLRRTPVTRGA